MQLDDDVGKVAVATPFLIAKALERFLSDLIEGAAELVVTNNQKKLQPRHLKAAISSSEKYKFLLHLVAKIQGDLEPDEKITEKNSNDKPQKRKTASEKKHHLGDSNLRGKRGRPRKLQASAGHIDLDTSNVGSKLSLPTTASVPITATTAIETTFDETDYD